MKKTFIRITAALIVLLMLVLPFSSCAGGKDLLTLKADGKT